MPITIEYQEGAVPITGSSESNAAREIVDYLKRKVIDRFPDASGRIYVISSYRFHGQSRRDIDILVIADVDGMCIRGDFDVKNKDRHYHAETLDVRTFICNIELKSHEKVIYNTGAYKVKYGCQEENVTDQANQARYSLVNYLKRLTGLNVFIWDVLWFNSITKETLNNIRGGIIDNAIAGNFDFEDMLQAILTQANVRYDHKSNSAELNSFNRKVIPTVVDQICRRGSSKKTNLREFNDASIFQADIIYHGIAPGKEFNVLETMAGGGKTLQLISTALSLSENIGESCVLICPNNAIVMDVQHMMDYLNIPYTLGHQPFEIMSFRRFFIEMLNLPKNEEDSQLYELSLRRYIGEQLDKEDVKWKFVLIDEAQNMADLEKSILLKIYDTTRIIVGCSMDPFMWNITPQKWIVGQSKLKIHTSNISIRQKVNLVRFVKAFARELGLLWPIESSPNLPGGNIRIYGRYNTNIHSELLSNVKNADGIPYDILYLMPQSQSTKDPISGRCRFSKANSWFSHGIDVFDGMDGSSLYTYPPLDKVRVFPYMSCAGLEAWCVVCYEFDKWIQHIVDSIDITGIHNQSEADRLIAQMSLLPLTRPIDTLIFTLSDQDSRVGQILHRLADSNSDFVKWLIY